MSGLRRFRIAMVALALLAIPALLPPAAAAAPQDDWAWAVVRDPTSPGYVITGKDRGTGSGGPVRVRRDGPGTWTVIFEDFAGVGGTVHVTALSGRPRLCTVVGWDFPAADLNVVVSCFDRAGRHVATPFVVSFLQAYSLSGTRAYVWADQPAVDDYVPSDTYQFNSSAALVDNTIHRFGTGQYAITLPGLVLVGGNVQVTAYGDEARVCRAVSWYVGTDYPVIDVRCRDAVGSLVDSTFTASLVQDQGLKGNGGPSWGGPSWEWLWANQPRALSYAPAACCRDGDPSGRARIERLSTGVYRVKLTDMPLGGAAQVTATGSGRPRCNVGGIRKSRAPQRIVVRCFKADGSSPADSRFTLSFER